MDSIGTQLANMHVGRDRSVSSTEAEELELGKTLFVGDLARDLDADDLKACFVKCGNVINVDIKRDRLTNNSLGYGFVEYETHEEAARAKRELSSVVLGARAIRLGWAQKNTNLFVGDIDHRVTTEMLRDEFRKFGPLFEEDTFVKEGCSYGFVRFRKREDAEMAKKEMHGKALLGRNIRIGWGDAKSIDNCVHFRFDPECPAIKQNNFYEEVVRDAFAAFGPVESVSLPRMQGDISADAGYKYKGFGFVYFANSPDGQEAAAKAISVLNGASLGGVEITCRLGKKPGKKKARKPGVFSVHSIPTYEGNYPMMPPGYGSALPPQQPASHNAYGRGRRSGTSPRRAAPRPLNAAPLSPVQYHGGHYLYMQSPYQQPVMLSPQYMTQGPGSPPISPSSPLINASLGDASPPFGAALPPTASAANLPSLPNALSMGLPGSPAFRAAALSDLQHHRIPRQEDGHM